MPVLISRETMPINPAAFIDQLAQAFLGRQESFIFIWEFSLNMNKAGYTASGAPKHLYKRVNEKA